MRGSTDVKMARSCWKLSKWRIEPPKAPIFFVNCMVFILISQICIFLHSEFIEMVEQPKLLNIVVVDGIAKSEGKHHGSFRYTRPVLQSTLQLMGCKARHAFKISGRVFEVMRNEHSDDDLHPSLLRFSGLDVSRHNGKEKEDYVGGCVGNREVDNCFLLEEDEGSNSKPFELYKQQTTIVVGREKFLDVVCGALSDYKYVGLNQRADLVLACRIRERRESVTVLLCGASGCGKSTLSALLASRLGITTVISTDSIRHMMRSFVDEKQNPLVWASTYHAGEFLDPKAVAEAKAKRKAKKLAGISHFHPKGEVSFGTLIRSPSTGTSDVSHGSNEFVGRKQLAIEGFKAQSEMVIDSLDRLIRAWEEQKESVVVEGVHLSLNFVMELMKKHASIIPFMVYISNEDKHLERFAVRAKYMTLDPAKNKYVKYIRNIRTIQEYLCNRADKHLVPKINNTNVDRSVATIHATVFSCLRRLAAGEPMYDPATSTVAMIDEEYWNQCAANSLSSKGMFQLIQRKGYSRPLMMALLNTDGSVAKAWPVESDDSGKPLSARGSEKSIASPVYGPVQVGNAEPVNLQFGSFGISAFLSDTGGTSHAGSFDESRVDWTENGSSRYYSSCCSSPRMFDGPAKELTEELSVSGSDEEAEDPPEVDSDEDLSGDEKQILEEMEGSVDEDFTKSDEECDDLAMKDGQDNGYVSDDEGEPKKEQIFVSRNQSGDKHCKDLDLFMKCSIDRLYEPFGSFSLQPENKRSYQRWEA